MATAVEPNPHVKEHNGTYICFADTLQQANTALTERQTGQKPKEDLAKASHLMLFGVEEWQPKDVASFSKNISSSTFERIEIFGSTLSEDHQKQIAQGFATIAATKVDLDNTELSEKGAASIMQALAGTAVSEINLQGSVKGTNVLKAIMDNLKASKALTKLDLKINDIKKEAGKSIAEFMATASSQDVELDLFYNDLQAEGAETICAGLSRSTVVTKLDLCCNGIGDKGAQAIATALVTNRTLRVLKLALNNIGNVGGNAIMKTLYMRREEGFANPNFALKVLDLSANVMKDENDNSGGVGETLVFMVNHAYGLHDFDFTGVELTDNGWSRLGNAFVAAASSFEHSRQGAMNNAIRDKSDLQYHFDVNTTRMLRFSIVDLMSQDRLSEMETYIWNKGPQFDFIDWRRKEPVKDDKKDGDKK